MYKKLSNKLDELSDILERRGFLREAYQLDIIANTIEVLAYPKSRYEVLEERLERAYKRGAPQVEIDRLETELAKLVSEENVIPGTSEPATSEGGHDIDEGISIEEELRHMYKSYIGARDAGERERFLGQMRSVLEGTDYIYTTERPNRKISDEEILGAAKDVYEHHLKLRSRREGLRGKTSPSRELERLREIRKRLKK